MSSKTPIRCAVVGVGYLGRFHAQKYHQLQEAELVGVCDASLERATEVAKELGTQAFTNPQELISKVDAVTIAATTTAHYELARMFLEAGIHVNVEKPITETVEQAEKLCATAKEKNLIFTVGHIERFNPVFVAIEKQLQSPVLMESRRHAPFRRRGSEVSVVHDLMIHDIDLALKLAGSPVKSVTARGGQFASATWDTVSASLEFQSGFLAHISVSRVSSQMVREMRVVDQDHGIYSGDFIKGEIEKISPLASDESPLQVDVSAVEKQDALLLETQEFLNSILNKTPGRVRAEDGLAALRVVEQVIDAL